MCGGAPLARITAASVCVHARVRACRVRVEQRNSVWRS